MRNWPTWLPNPGSWMNALFLTLLMGVVASSIKFTGQMGQVLYQHFSSRLGLTFGVLAVLSPILVIAVAHHLLHLFLGGPIGAAVVGSATYILKRNEEKPESSVSYVNQVSQAYADVALDYLTRFSTQALVTLQQYEETAEKVISFTITEERLKITS